MVDIEVTDRFKNYNKTYCWQYSIRLQNREEDLKLAGLTEADVENLRVSDFEFAYVHSAKDDRNIPIGYKKVSVGDSSAICNEVKAFIVRHEWLGKLSLFPTHRFTARHRGILAGVIIMDQPAVFSKLLGDKTRKIERLVSRGACVSWSPKNLASALLMWSIKWMVANTRYRVFTAYSDPEAKELGTIYQAANFIYLGKTSGTQKMYRDPLSEKRGWFSDRSFRSRSSYKRYAKNLGIVWDATWQGGNNILWGNIPAGIALKLKQAAKDHQKRCLVREVPRKHKYAYILGRDRKETRELMKQFEERNPDLIGLSYPKDRGQ